MANMGPATIELKVIGNMLVILEAFRIMTAALAAYGHEFDDEQMTTIDTAIDELTKAGSFNVDI